MNIIQRKLKPIVSAIALGVLLSTTFNSMVMASPVEHGGQRQVSEGSIHEHMKAKLNKLAERLEIRSSQQAAWEEYAKSIEALTEPSTKRPGDDADAATISRYRADRATEFSIKLSVVADSTAKLQKVLAEDQRKVLNQAAQHFLNKRHGWRSNNRCRGADGTEWQRRGMEQ